MRPATIYNIFLGVVRLTPWIQGRFFLFPESVFVSNVMEKRDNGFPEIFMKCQGRPKK